MSPSNDLAFKEAKAELWRLENAAEHGRRHLLMLRFCTALVASLAAALLIWFGSTATKAGLYSTLQGYPAIIPIGGSIFAAITTVATALINSASALKAVLTAFEYRSYLLRLTYEAALVEVESSSNLSH